MAISNKRVRLLAIFFRVVVGAVFVYGGFVKLFQFVDGRLQLLPWQLFAMAVDSYKVLPQTAVEIVARTLPWFELGFGLVLIIGVWLRWTSVLASVMMAVFLSLMVHAYINGQQISCGCFGPGEIISWKTLLRDGSLLAASLFVTASAFLRRNLPGKSLTQGT